METALETRATARRGSTITVLDLAAVRKIGVAEAARRAVDRFERNELDGFWIHLDADVLDDEVMPAVDSRQPDGLSRDELIALLKALLASRLAVGMEVTIFDPDLDPDGKIASAFADDLVAALADERTLLRIQP